MWCHVLLYGFPVVGIALFWVLPFPVALGLYLPLAALSVGIGMVTVRALAAPLSTGAEGMRGREARVEAADGRSIVVKVDSELWNAVASEALAPGDRVVIVGVDRLRLTVRRP